MLAARLNYLVRRIGYGRRNIEAHLTAYIDRKSVMEGGNFIANGVTLLGSRLGAFTYINSHSFISNTVIGRYSCIGRDVLSGLGGHPTGRRSVHRMFYSDEMRIWKEFFYQNDFEEQVPVCIGNDVWIGARVIIMDGVTIGDGAIVAGGSVVTNNVEPFSIVAGSPARKIRSRFSDAVCDELKMQRWWDWSLEEVRRSVRTGEFNRELDTK